MADFGRLIHQDRSQNTSNGAHKPSIETTYTRIDCLTPETTRFILGVLEHPSRHTVIARLKLDQSHATLVWDGQRRIGHAKVDHAIVGSGYVDERTVSRGDAGGAGDQRESDAAMEVIAKTDAATTRRLKCTKYVRSK